MSKENPTLGESRVGVTFNPSNDENVDLIKAKTAELIDLCKSSMDPGSVGNSEKDYCFATAMTHYENAAMWAVKGNFR